jgi:hypothetical protein
VHVFGFDPSEYRERYARDGWVHVQGGVDPDLLSELREFASRRVHAHHVSGRGIGGKKQQAVFEFPAAVDFPDHLFDVVAAVAGLRRENMTLSERHIKAYDADAPADPPAHKDRLSSQVSVGLSIAVPAESHLVLYPYAHREVNPFNVSAALRESLTEEQLPENLLRGARELVIHDRPGDVMMFQGSSIWHKRRNGAGAVNLYLKFNDFGSDPLGEDPRTPRLREATLAALRDGDLSRRVPVSARRLDTITRQLTREPGVEVLQADVWGAGPVRLTEDDFALLRSLDGSRTAGQIVDAAASAGRQAEAVEAALRRLAARGVVDLVTP